MSTPIIQVEGLSKRFILSHEVPQRYKSLREEITRKITGVFGASKQAEQHEEFYALRDVNFEIHAGDRVGIIGRNGSGKSTLLKILSRITEPSAGKVTIRGRVASLLEVGTGFHPELTGRENIYLNGAILGMSRARIKEKFSEIVAFAEVERFLDTPVKRYSSGMYVRLAFAVAAHLEPEILVVDEVLAVGDAEFQKKCLGKMDNLSKEEGRTVLFVSHNMGVISQLCDKAILLNSGQILYGGKTEQAIDLYINRNGAQKADRIERAPSDTNQFLQIYNSDADCNPKSEFKFNEEIFLFVELNLPAWRETLELAVSLYDKHKRRVFTIHEPLKKFYDGQQRMKFRLTIPSGFLTPGRYSWLMCINFPGFDLFDLQDDVCGLTIMETGSEFSQYENSDYGCVFVPYKINLSNK